jgi:glyoxylase I family protein
MLKALHHVNLIVSDMEKTKAFYSGILGLPIALETIIEDGEFSRGVGLPDTKVIATFFQLPNGAGLLETFQYARPAGGKSLPADKQANDAGWTHICFVVDDIEKEVKDLERQGISFLSTPVTIARTHPHLAGVRFCYFLGPDREVVEVLQA